jgi:phage shock protein PspC (stress-responsive transcriptional regulator)
MKKTLQINLGGLTFNIEETAFQKLNQYLDAIQKYFASYEGSSEIVADIESRMAEKFFLKTENGGVIEDEDVAKIIATMGTVDDFEAVKEDEDLIKESATAAASETTESETPKANKPKSRLFRDGKRKALGGVLAGLANHFEIDVVWFRILFIVIAFGSLQSGLGLGFILAYIIAWVAIPENMDLEDNNKVKKFYRNPENKVLGGVASGLSSYLSIDIVIVRVIFVITGFFFVGIFIYLIFWIVAPTANTITQKMELKGEPVTIENIESNIKMKSQGVQKQESAISKLLLFPFRLIGIIIGAFGKLLKPMGSILKIFVGLILLLLGGSLAFATLIATGVFFGVLQDGTWIHTGGVIGMFTKDIPMVGGFFAFLTLFVPAAAIVVIALSLLTGQRHGNKNFWLTALMLWFGGIVGVSTIGSQYALNFSKKGGYEEKTSLVVPSNILILDANKEEFYDENDDEDFYNIAVSLRTSADQNLILNKKFISKGRTRELADKYARMMTYSVMQKDSIINFDRKLKISGNKVFRDQHLIATLEIPKGKKFKMTERFADRILSSRWHISEKYDIDFDDIEKFTFQMTDNDEIQCLDCPELSEEEKDAVRNFDGDQNIFDNNDFEDVGEFSKKYDLDQINELELGANFIINVKYGATQSVEIFCNDKKDLDDLEVSVSGRKLKVEYGDPFRDHDSKVNIKITLPMLTAFDLSGAAQAKILGFENVNTMNATLSGASKAALDVKTDKINIEAGGASVLVCKGTAKVIEMELSGSSKFYGKDFPSDKARVEASGASEANMGKVLDLKSDVSGGSTVNHE